MLRNIRGERFMQNYHPQQELAPRDVVANAIVSELERTKATFVYLDVTHESEEMVRHRFPTIYETCLLYGLDLTTDWIPVAPAAHYMMGGVKTDLNGETNISRLFACGEVSSTGVHGANRLASNSLSEAIVFGRRIIHRIEELSPLEGEVQVRESVEDHNTISSQAVVEKRLKLQKVMVREIGLRRSADSLSKGLGELKRQLPFLNSLMTKREEFEFANLLTISLLTAESASARTESRGAHYRVDFPLRNDSSWRKHTVLHRVQGLTEESIHDAAEL